MIKKYCRVRDHSHYTSKYRCDARCICNLKYSVPKEIPVVFHNGSSCDYNFVKKELAKEFGREFDCLGENTEKYKIFLVLITKEVKPVSKNGEESTKVILYKFQLIARARFMTIKSCWQPC